MLACDTLTVLDRLPDGLLHLSATQLHQVIPSLTLIHLPGKQEPPLFVSVLLHGNETTSWLAIQALLREYAGGELPRALSLLIGNVEAARYGQRHLPHQPDYNRIWQPGDRPEQRIAQQVIDAMRSRGVFASIDIHNNTGKNPHYGCVTRLDNRSLYLARLFANVVVYFTTPKTVQSAAFAPLCPSIVVECGQPGQPEGTQHAMAYVRTCLELDSLPDIHPGDIDLFHTVAVVKVPEEVRFGFEADNHKSGTNGGTDDTSDIYFDADLDRLNFRELAPGTPLCRIHPGRQPYLEAWDEEGCEVSDRYFCHTETEIVLTKSVMPSMLTRKPEIIRQDCLCYLMERIHQPLLPGAAT